MIPDDASASDTSGPRTPERNAVEPDVIISDIDVENGGVDLTGRPSLRKGLLAGVKCTEAVVVVDNGRKRKLQGVLTKLRRFPPIWTSCRLDKVPQGLQAANGGTRRSSA